MMKDVVFYRLQNIIKHVVEFENLDSCDNGCSLTINPIIIYFLLIVIIVVLLYCYKQKQIEQRLSIGENCKPILLEDILCERNVFLIPKIEINELYPLNRNKTSMRKLRFERPKLKSVTMFVTIYRTRLFEGECDRNHLRMSVAAEMKRSLSTLVYYCDGSYSHYMQIGHAGFRTSNGLVRICSYFPWNPRSGSTETEVLAAYLAIQYALEQQQYNTLIIYTDNSKVEQILKYRKELDKIKYRDICQVLDTFHRQNQNNSIIVKRVRGHPTQNEQRKCKDKHNFAEIDRIVRENNRQSIKHLYYYF